MHERSFAAAAGFGRLGHGAHQRVVAYPKWVAAFETHPVHQLAVGDFHNVALTTDGRVYSQFARWRARACVCVCGGYARSKEFISQNIWVQCRSCCETAHGIEKRAKAEEVQTDGHNTAA